MIMQLRMTSEKVLLVYANYINLEQQDEIQTKSKLIFDLL